MEDDPRNRQVAIALREFAKQPRIAKMLEDLMQAGSSERMQEVRRGLSEFRSQYRPQPPRPLYGEQASKKRPRGRPKGSQYKTDDLLVLGIRERILTTQVRRILPVAREFAAHAEGSFDVESKARRLERAYRKRFGSE